MHISCKPEVVAEMQHLIDVCDFGTVKAYFRDPHSEITGVIIVQEEYILEEVAAVFRDPVAAPAISLMNILVFGAVKIGVDDLSRVREGQREHAVLLDEFPDNRYCDVICLPPFYIVKLRGKLK